MYCILLFIIAALHNYNALKQELPAYLERQKSSDVMHLGWKDVYCYIHTLNNALQKKEYEANGNTKKFLKWIEKVEPDTKDKIVEWGKLGGMGASVANNDYWWAYASEFAGYKYESCNNCAMFNTDQSSINLNDDSSQMFGSFAKGTVGGIKTLMSDANFQAWIIKIVNGNTWVHYVTITRNGNKWFYLDPIFPIINIEKPSIWKCKFVGYTHNIDAYERLLTNYDKGFKRSDCARGARFGQEGIKYLASRYLGNGNDGIKAAIAKLKELFNGIRYGDEGSLTQREDQCKFKSAGWIYKVTNNEQSQFFKKYFDIIAIKSENLKKKDLDTQLALIPDRIIKLKKIKYISDYNEGTGFWGKSKDVNTANIIGSTPEDTESDHACRVDCKYDHGKDPKDPDEWTIADTRYNLYVEWRRRQDLCASKYPQEAFKEDESDDTSQIKLIDYNYNPSPDYIVLLTLIGFILLIFICGCLWFTICGLIGFFSAYFLNEQTENKLNTTSISLNQV